MQDRVLKYWLIAPALLVVAGTLLFPLISALWYSLHDWKLSESPTLGPFVGFDNYVLAVTDDPDLLNSGWVTLIFTILSVVCTLTVAMALAVLLAGKSGVRRVQRRDQRAHTKLERRLIPRRSDPCHDGAHPL